MCVLGFFLLSLLFVWLISVFGVFFCLGLFCKTLARRSIRFLDSWSEKTACLFISSFGFNLIYWNSHTYLMCFTRLGSERTSGIFML